jgi:hypothetical protein
VAAMILYLVYILSVVLVTVVALIVTGNPLAMFGLIFLMFMSNVVPMLQAMGGSEERESAIGFHAGMDAAVEE